jgi:hypothetical protein
MADAKKEGNASKGRGKGKVERKSGSPRNRK